MLAEPGRRPEVVVVEEGDPGSPSGGDATVAGTGDTLVRLLSQQAYARVGMSSDERHARIVRAVVDDEYLEIDIDLAYDRIECARQKLPTVERRYDDTHLGHDIFLTFWADS
jgi:hypothetical protein